MPKVSVIIPTQNRAHFVETAVQSVLNQTFQDFEIFVVDDASVDQTPQVMQAFVDPRISYVRHECRMGQGVTRNDGIRRASGEYIALLDDDDEWLPRKLEKQVFLLDRSSSEIGLVYTGFRKIDATTRELIADVIPAKRGYLFEQMFIRNWIGTCSTVLLRRSCLMKTGLFDETLVSGADYDLWLRVSEHFAVEFISEPLVNYNVHSNNLTQNYPLIIRGMEATNKKYEPLFATHRKPYSNRYHCIGMFYCLEGDVQKGREAFLKAIKIYPFDLRYYFRLSTCLLGAEYFKKSNKYKEIVTARLRRMKNRLTGKGAEVSSST